VGANGPSCRIVLLRSVDPGGFVFFTNYNSGKALQLEGDARAALLFFWPQHERQVRIEGGAERIAGPESDAYFRSRPRGSRIGAWASDQSARIADRRALDEKYLRWQERFLEDEIPRPMHWGGYRVKPLRIEFWQGRNDRMHDRLLFTLNDRGDWSRARLQP
jgi:pyridoxamine 5'-phosphate oxidase